MTPRWRRLTSTFGPCSRRRFGRRCWCASGRPGCLGRRRGVPETPAAVTDTHPLLFHAAGTGKLGKAAKAHFDACERREAMIYVPMVVIWECALLAGAARINLRRSVRAFFDDLFSNP